MSQASYVSELVPGLKLKSVQGVPINNLSFDEALGMQVFESCWSLHVLKCHVVSVSQGSATTPHTAVCGDRAYCSYHDAVGKWFRRREPRCKRCKKVGPTACLRLIDTDTCLLRSPTLSRVVCDDNPMQRQEFAQLQSSFSEAMKTASPAAAEQWCTITISTSYLLHSF